MSVGSKSLKRTHGPTAVSSRLLSVGSTFPPGKDVSPAYVLNVADRLLEH